MNLRKGIAFAIGAMSILALPLTEEYQIPHVRGVTFGVIAVFFGLVVLGGARLRRMPVTLVCCVLFVAWVGVGVVYTRAPEYGLSKFILVASYYAVLGITIYQALAITDGATFMLRGLWSGGIALTLVAFITFGNPLTILTDATRYFRLHFGEEGNPISLARYLSVLILLSVWMFWGERKKLLPALAIGPVVVVAALYMVMTGSKGPLLALAAGLACGVWIYARNRMVAVLWSILLLIGVGGGFALVLPDHFVSQRFVERLSDLSLRLPVYQRTIDAIATDGSMSFVVGHGTGDFGYFLLRRDEPMYPHNILLEIMYENGLIGLCLFLAFAIPPIAAALTSKAGGLAKQRRYELAAFGGLFVMALMNAQATADIAGNSFIPMFGAGLIAVLDKYRSDHRKSPRTTVFQDK